jgi:maleate cis-trans isomerase
MLREKLIENFDGGKLTMPLNASLGAPYGWRARVGLITPSPGHENNAYEFYLIAPQGVTVCMTSLRVMGLTQEQYSGALGRMEAAVAEMVSRKVDAMVQAGVPLTVTQGWDFHNELTAQVAKLTNIPFATDIGACIEAMQFLGMQRVVMITPFDDAMHDKLARYVSSAGIKVLAARSIRPPAAEEISRHYDVSTVPLSVPYQAAKALFRATPSADGIWITGALMPSVAAIQPLEQDLDVPVVTSMQAMAWAGLRLAGVKAEVNGYGRLFQRL